MVDFVTYGGLTFVAALLGLTGGAHARHPARLATVLDRQGVVPLRAVPALVGLVILCEFGVAAAAGLALITADRAVVGVASAAALILGIAFFAYLRYLLRRGHTESCGCTPLDAPLSTASLVPAGALAVASAVALGASIAGDGGAAHETAWPALAIIWGIALVGPVILLPATAPAGATARLSEVRP